MALAKLVSETTMASTIIGGFLSPFPPPFSDFSVFFVIRYPIKPTNTNVISVMLIVFIFII